MVYEFGRRIAQEKKAGKSGRGVKAVGMTITENLAAHAGRRSGAGRTDQAKLDLVMDNDITGPVAMEEFRRLGLERVFDPERVVLVPDHFTPNKDIKSAEQAKLVREFARKQGLLYYFEVGRMGN